MNIKNKRLCFRVFGVLAVTASIIYAGNNLSQPSTLDYSKMSTTNLQIEVEKLANEHKLSLDIEHELMKRWKTASTTIH